MPVTRGTARQPKNTPAPEPEEVQEEVAEEEQEEEASDEEVQEEEPAEEEADTDEEVDSEEADVEEEPESDEEAESGETASEPESETPSEPARRGRPRSVETPTPAPRPAISKAQKAALFNEYETRRALVMELREHLDTAKKEVAAACYEIYEKLGKGPFRWKGKVIKVVKSKNSPAASIRVVSDEAEDIG